MKYTLTLAALVLVTTAASGFARDHGERPDFSTLDADGSGEITLEDFAALRDERFGEIDANQDGSVDRAEFVAHAQARAANRAEEMFDRIDVDGDGVLSLDAVASRMGERSGRGIERMLRRFDADSSGGISAEEFAAAQERMAGRRDRDHTGKRGRGN
jgi:Ca2+-binding EF-hand superfamily protein